MLGMAAGQGALRRPDAGLRVGIARLGASSGTGATPARLGAGERLLACRPPPPLRMETAWAPSRCAGCNSTVGFNCEDLTGSPNATICQPAQPFVCPADVPAGGQLSPAGLCYATPALCSRGPNSCGGDGALACVPAAACHSTAPYMCRAPAHPKSREYVVAATLQLPVAPGAVLQWRQGVAESLAAWLAVTPPTVALSVSAAWGSANASAVAVQVVAQEASSILENRRLLYLIKELK